VEFFLSANPGEEPRPLARVASGGELSRLMLTLRTVALSRRRRESVGEAGTIVFDEIDVGVGGRVAEAVGRRLKALAEGRQVLCVTHQPQIARFASHHFVVRKSFEGGRTLTSIRELDLKERVEELARMIGGEEEGAQTTLEAARWLLESARSSVLTKAGGRRARGQREN
jgi:DNA repair protein RecN (Recombination protein N)